MKADEAEGMEATGGAQVGGLAASPPPRPPTEDRELLLYAGAAAPDLEGSVG